jgi:hypothetical protein
VRLRLAGPFYGKTLVFRGVIPSGPANQSQGLPRDAPGHTSISPGQLEAPSSSIVPSRRDYSFLCSVGPYVGETIKLSNDFPRAAVADGARRADANLGLGFERFFLTRHSRQLARRAVEQSMRPNKQELQTSPRRRIRTALPSTFLPTGRYRCSPATTTASSRSISPRPTTPSASAGAVRRASPTARCWGISVTRSPVHIRGGRSDYDFAYGVFSIRAVVSFLRCTAGRSKGSSVSSVMAAVAQG